MRLSARVPERPRREREREGERERISNFVTKHSCVYRNSVGREKNHLTVMVDQRFFHPALVTTNVLAYNSARFLFRFDGLKIKDAPKYPASLHLHQCARGMYFLPRVTQKL